MLGLKIPGSGLTSDKYWNNIANITPNTTQVGFHTIIEDKIIFEEVKNEKYQLLFDPQTVGGIAFIVS